MRYPLRTAIGAFSVFVMLSSAAAGQLASRPAEEWSKTLDQPNRIAGLRAEEVIARIGLKAGLTVADLGAGTGLFSIPMGRAVAPGGRVYAVEVDKGYFGIIQEKARDAQV